MNRPRNSQVVSFWLIYCESVRSEGFHRVSGTHLFLYLFHICFCFKIYLEQSRPQINVATSFFSIFNDMFEYFHGKYVKVPKIFSLYLCVFENKPDTN